VVFTAVCVYRTMFFEYTVPYWKLTVLWRNLLPHFQGWIYRTVGNKSVRNKSCHGQRLDGWWQVTALQWGWGWVGIVWSNKICQMFI